MNGNRASWKASDGLTLMLRPSLEYSKRVAAARDASWTRALTVPGLLTLLLGIVTSVGATGRIVASLVVSQSLCWSFVPALQLATGSILIASAQNRRVTFARAVELLFAAHGPWSLWLVAVGAYQSVDGNQDHILLSTLIASTWTAWMLAAFGREALALTAGQSRTRVFLHQAATALLILVYIELTTRLSVRVLGMLR